MDSPSLLPGQPNPSPMIGRGERMAMEEIGRTQIRQSHAAVFIGLFLAFLFGVLISDLPVLGRLPGIAAKSPAPPARGRDVTSMLPKWTARVFEQNRVMLEWIRSTERVVDEQSRFVRASQPCVQNALAACGEGGTEAMLGRDGWLFYRPSFRFLTRPVENLTDHAYLSGRVVPAKAAGFRASLKAILPFAEALRQRGISLVVVPVWPKLSIHPEHLGAPDHGAPDVVKPASFVPWCEALDRAGVMVFDPASSIMAAKMAQNGEAYLKTDSHWTAVTMQRCAVDLARFLTERGLATRGTAVPTMVPSLVSNQGDLARMLQLPVSSRYFPPEQAAIMEVRGELGTRWLTSRASPVLLLGDSFTNIFSLASMGWGQDAGLAEHLGAALAMPVDAILRNGDGESATRGLLARELASGKDRLAGKKVVVWAFSATQITEGDWLPFSYQLGASQPSAGTYVELGDDENREVTGTVAEMGMVPHPSATVYKEYVGYFVLDDLQAVNGSALAGKRALVYGLVMKDHRWTDAAHLRPGQHIRASLRSWTSAEEEFGRHQRCEPAGDLIVQPVNWLTDFSLTD